MTFLLREWYNICFFFLDFVVEKPEEQQGTDSKETTKEQIEIKIEASEPLLSPPKSVNTDLLHQRRRSKNGVSTPQSASKFGRWFPIKNLNHAFTPRAVYCRSLSDPAAFAKNKKSPKPHLGRQESNESKAQETAGDQSGMCLTVFRFENVMFRHLFSNFRWHFSALESVYLFLNAKDNSCFISSKASRQKPWIIEEKKIPLVIPFGPMTPPPKPLNTRERTTSMTSEVSLLF